MNEEGLRRQDPGHRIRNLRHEPWPGFVPRREFFSKTGEFVEHCCYNPGPRATGQRAEGGINGSKTLPEREPASQGWPPEEWALDWQVAGGRDSAGWHCHASYKWEVPGTTGGLPHPEARVACSGSPFNDHQQSNLQGKANSHVCRICEPVGGHGPFPTQTRHAEFNSEPTAEMAAAGIGACTPSRTSIAKDCRRFVSRCRCNSKTIRNLGGDASHDVE